MSNTQHIAQSRNHFADARRKAFLKELFDTLRRRSTSPISLDDVRSRINVRGQRWLGHQTVPLANIVGSEGRYSDFDRQFLPRTDALRDRWTSIDRARLDDIVLPPVELYKAGDIYFVRDGNHRVSVARQFGQIDIDAYVTELMVDVPLSPDLATHDLLLKEEYSDFLEWTNLHELRPDERIEFSELGGYLELIQHINAHRYYLGEEQQRDIDPDEAVTHWYDEVYMPIVRVIREQHVLRNFPGRTEADLYRWIVDHRWYTHERTGTDPGPAAATESYVEQFSQRGLHTSIGEALRNALQKLGVQL
ncbi:MAG: DUF4032 domain-containing protein [Chloroflexi bacterium SZAS-1]|nr:DUF4032 domain-containing protein [Chloroflexi bacterium SZAS-1]